MNAESRLTTPFHSHATATEVIKGVDLTGRRAVVTGGASGIGTETVRALALAGAEVVVATLVRRPPSRWSANSPPPPVPDRCVPRHSTCRTSAPPGLRTGVARPAGHPGGQRRDHGASHAPGQRGGLGAAARHQLPRSLRPGRRPPPRSARVGLGPRRGRQLGCPPELALRLRRPALRAASLRPLGAYGQSKTADVLLAVGARRGPTTASRPTRSLPAPSSPTSSAISTTTPCVRSA